MNLGRCRSLLMLAVLPMAGCAASRHTDSPEPKEPPAEAPPETGTPTTPAAVGPAPVVRGTYIATSAGPIAAIAFDEDGAHLTLAARGCTVETCIDRASYRIDGDTLTLTNDATGKTTTMPFDVLSTRSGSGSESGSEPAVETQSLKIATGLVGGPVALIETAQSVLVGDTTYEAAAGAWDAACMRWLSGRGGSAETIARCMKLLPT
jgi:hypothetical protein